MRVIVGLLMLVWAAHAATADSSIEFKSGDFTFQVDVRAQANLIYHLDCLRRVSSCTSEVFEQLWRDQIGLADGDRQYLDDWASLRSEIDRKSSSDRNLPIKASVPIVGTRDNLTWSKVRYVDFVSSDAGELERGWSLLMPPASASRLIEIVSHFRPRFATWWRAQEAEAVNFIPGVEAALRKARAPELLNATARFYRSELSDRRLFIHLFLQPKTQRPNSQATVVGPHIVVEIEPNENPEERVPVIVHEIAHHLLARMPLERKARLAETVLASGPAGPPAWNLFDEVQATAIGNIIAGRNVMPPESFKKRFDAPRGFYNDDAIDLGARATETLFGTVLKKGAAMRSSFPADYVAALQAGIGDKLVTPALYLRSMMINVDDEKSPWLQKLRRAIRPSSAWTISPLGDDSFVEQLDRYPGLSVAVFARVEQTPKLAPASRPLGVELSALANALGESRGVVYVARRTTAAYAFFFVARDDESMDGLIGAFPACQLKPGVCVRIE